MDGTLYIGGKLFGFTKELLAKIRYHQELLADRPPYNFEDEDERLACERLRREEDTHG